MTYLFYKIVICLHICKPFFKPFMNLYFPVCLRSTNSVPFLQQSNLAGEKFLIGISGHVTRIARRWPKSHPYYFAPFCLLCTQCHIWNWLQPASPNPICIQQLTNSLSWGNEPWVGGKMPCMLQVKKKYMNLHSKYM